MPKEMISAADAGSSGSLPYISVTSSPVRDLGSEVVAKHPGLMAVQTVNEDDKYLHIAFWSSRDHYENARRHLTDELQSEPEHEGFAQALAKEKVPFWRRFTRFTLKDWLVSVTALYGAVQAFSNHVADLAAFPDAVIKTPEKAYMVLQGDRLLLEGTVESLLPSAKLRNVVLDAILKSDGKPDRKLELTQDRMAPIEPAKERKFPVELPAIEPGVYKIVLSVQACAGWLFCYWPKKYDREVDLRVFPNFPKGEVRLTRATEKSADFQVFVVTGTALKQSATCELTFAPGPAFRYVSKLTGDNVKFESLSGKDGLMRAGLSWPVGAWEAKKAFSRTFAFASEKPIEWSKLAANARVHCSKEQGA